MHLLLFPVQEREISKGLEGGAAAARGDTQEDIAYIDNGREK